MKIKITFMFATLFSVLLAGNSYATKAGSYSGVMKSIPFASITFDAGSAILTDAHRTKLRNLVKNAEARASIEQITVAAWADKNYPIGESTALTDADRALAERRLDAIEGFLAEDLAAEDVDTFNMASESNWLARTFRSDDAELKSVFGKKGTEVPVTKAEFQIIKNEGGPYEAVIVVERVMKK